MLKKIIHNLPYIRILRANLIKQGNTISNLRLKGNKCYKEYFIKKDYKKLDFEGKLQYLELKFGGFHTGVNPTEELGDLSRFSPSKLTGGDRFNPFYHDYSSKYSKYLDGFRVNNLLEIGILRGTGLATWCELYMEAKVYGFDWDLGNFKANEEYLISLGAFSSNKPILHQYNQLTDNSDWLKQNFKNTKFDLVIDDALHKDVAIINSFTELEPYLSDRFVYIIEDNRTAWIRLQENYPQYNFDNEDLLTIISS